MKRIILACVMVLATACSGDDEVTGETAANRSASGGGDAAESDEEATADDAGSADAADGQAPWWAYDAGPDAEVVEMEEGAAGDKTNGDVFVGWFGDVDPETGEGSYGYMVKYGDFQCDVTYEIVEPVVADGCEDCEFAWTIILGDAIDAVADGDGKDDEDGDGKDDQGGEDGEGKAGDDGEGKAGDEGEGKGEEGEGKGDGVEDKCAAGLGYEGTTLSYGHGKTLMDDGESYRLLTHDGEAWVVVEGTSALTADGRWSFFLQTYDVEDDSGKDDSGKDDSDKDDSDKDDSDKDDSDKDDTPVASNVHWSAEVNLETNEGFFQHTATTLDGETTLCDVKFPVTATTDATCGACMFAGALGLGEAEVLTTDDGTWCTDQIDTAGSVVMYGHQEPDMLFINKGDDDTGDDGWILVDGGVSLLEAPSWTFSLSISFDTSSL